MRIVEEQNEEWVKIKPEEYLELLKYSGDNSKVITKLPKFRGKKIWITGNLDVSGKRELKSLDGIGYIEGSLNMTHSGIADISNITVTSHVSDWGSRRDEIRKKRERDKKLSEAQDRRDFDEWDLKNEDIDEVGFTANAIFDNISGRFWDIVKDKDDDKKLVEHEKELEKLLKREKEYEAEGRDLTDIHSDIEVHQDAIDEIVRKVDIYNLIPQPYGWYGMNSFEFVSNNDAAPNGSVYAASTWNDVEQACREALEEHLQYPKQYFREDFLKNYIDEDEVVSYFESFYEDDIRESPESYFDDSDYELTDEQERKIQSLQLQIDELEHKKENADEGSEEYDSLQEEIDNLQTEMDEIVPDTDEPTENMIAEKVEEMLRDVRRNPTSYMEEFGMDIENYLDKDSIIDDAINSDGPGAILGTYDGDYDTQEINNETYYIFRTE